MWNKTTQIHHGVSRFFPRLLLRVGVVGVVLLSEGVWADRWPIEPPLEAAYVDWENLSMGVSGKAPPHFLVSSVAQSHSNSERLARLDAAERLSVLVRGLRLSSTLTLGECAPEGKLKEALASGLLSWAPTAHWRFSDGGQSFFFKQPLAWLAPLCPKLAKAMAQLPSLPAQEVLAAQSEAKVLWVVSPPEAKAEPCLFPVLVSEDSKWFLDTAEAGYVVVWSAHAPAWARKAAPSKAAPSKATLSKAAPSKSQAVAPQNAAWWAISAKSREDCGIELSNEVAARLDSKMDAKQLEQRIVVRMQGKAP